MKIIIITINILLCYFYYIFSLNSQMSTSDFLYLSNYSFSKGNENTPVSEIIYNNSQSYPVKLTGENADLYVLKDNEIFLTNKGVQFFQNNNKSHFTLQVRNNDKVLLEKSFLFLKDEFIKNGVIAHRGAWKDINCPQNSIESLQNAINLGCEGSEFDVHLTADTVLVVYHDPKFYGMTIEKTNYKDLLDFKLENGESIPTLEDYLKIGMSQQRTRLICELKKSVISNERSMLLVKKVLEKVREKKAEAWMVFISFDYNILKKIVEIENSFQTMYLGGNISPDKLKDDGVDVADYHYSVYQIDNEWINWAHKIGIKTNAWTVNDSLIMDYLISYKTDYITTDEPRALLRRLDARKSLKTKKLVWSDEFNYQGIPDSTKWSCQTGGHGWGNNEQQYYTSCDTQNVMVKKGLLYIIAQKQVMDKRSYTSARLISKYKGDWKYGEVEIRARLPKGRGLWPAIWMLPTDNVYGGWPASGEIDIMEHVGYSPDSVFMTVHTKDLNHMIGTQVSKGTRLSEIYSDFHIYNIDWQADKIDFFIDGIKYLTFKNSQKGFGEWPFDQRFYLIMNIAVGGNWGGKKGIDESIFPAQMEIDYVRVYQVNK